MALRQKSPSRYWSQVMRWDRENSQILYDTDNRIRNMLKEKLIFPDSEQKELMKRRSREVQEYLWFHFDVWERRGEPVNVSHALVHGAENIILWIYAKNKRFQPYIPKWLFFHLENGSVPESKHFESLKAPFIEAIKSMEQARRIRNDLLRVCDDIGLKLKYEGIEDLQARSRENWEKASEKTKRYLSW